MTLEDFERIKEEEILPKLCVEVGALQDLLTLVNPMNGSFSFGWHNLEEENPADCFVKHEWALA